MIRFIRRFIRNLQDYDSYLRFWCERPEHFLKHIEEGHWYKNRFDFAWKNTLLWWKHRDKYSRKCRKARGDCEHCNAKHC